MTVHFALEGPFNLSLLAFSLSYKYLELIKLFKDISNC